MHEHLHSRGPGWRSRASAALRPRGQRSSARPSAQPSGLGAASCPPPAPAPPPAAASASHSLSQPRLCKNSSLQGTAAPAGAVGAGGSWPTPGAGLDTGAAVPRAEESGLCPASARPLGPEKRHNAHETRTDFHASRTAPPRPAFEEQRTSLERHGARAAPE